MAKVVVIAERCKSCQYCIKFCPKNVLALGTKVNLAATSMWSRSMMTALAAVCARASARMALSKYTNKRRLKLWQEY